MGSGIMINRSHLLNYFILHFTSEKKKKKIFKWAHNGGPHQYSNLCSSFWLTDQN
jgi:hypothetical protein